MGTAKNWRCADLGPAGSGGSMEPALDSRCCGGGGLGLGRGMGVLGPAGGLGLLLGCGSVGAVVGGLTW